MIPAINIPMKIDKGTKKSVDRAVSGELPYSERIQELHDEWELSHPCAKRIKGGGVRHDDVSGA